MRRRLVVVIVAALALAGCPRGASVLGTADPALRPQVDRFAAAVPVPRDDPHLDLFHVVLTKIVAEYVDPIAPEPLVDAAITGLAKPGVDRNDATAVVDAGITAMAESLPERGGYFSAELTRPEPAGAGGIGVELALRDGRLTVVDALDGGPAEEAGVGRDDRILAIDDRPTDGMSLVDGVRTLRGPVDSEVRVRIVRRGSPSPIDLTLRRRHIEIALASTRLPRGLGWIRIRQFNNRTNDELARALDAFTVDGPLTGLVLDLRNNEGGLLTAAVLVADRFLRSGVVVRTVGRHPERNQTFHARDDRHVSDVPLVVLVNRVTASGAEIVAAALRDQGRGRIAGTRTAGRGIVNTMFPFGVDAMLRLATARAFTPLGAPIGDGVQPDLVLPEADTAPRTDVTVVERAAALLDGVR